MDTDGVIKGKHRGLHLYTLGQRKGHGVASPRDGVAYVVVGKNIEDNTLIVGYEDTCTTGLYAKSCVVGTVSWVNKPITCRVKVEAQPRYRANSEPVYVTPREGGKFDVEFVREQRALTPGQICAFYADGMLLGGGIFESIG